MKREVKSDRVIWIDALKGIAICGVVLIHSGASGLPSILGRLGNLGKNGVQIFFIISAYLAYSSLEKWTKDNSGETFALIRKWWFHKFLKLIPLYYTAIIAYLFIEGAGRYWLGSEGHISLLNVLFHMLFMHGFIPHYIDSIIGVEWYLAIFYLLAPFLYKYINSIEKAFVGLILTMYGYSFAERLIHLDISVQDSYIYENYFASFWFVRQIPILFCGIILYFLLRSDALGKIKNKKMMSYALLILFGIMIAGEMYGKNTLFGMKGDIRISLWLTGVIISQALYSNVLINNRVLQVLGRNSYPIYLIHFFVIYIYDKMILISTGKMVLDWGIKYIFIMGSSYLLSLIFTRWLDKPIQSFILRNVNRQ